MATLTVWEGLIPSMPRADRGPCASAAWTCRQFLANGETWANAQTYTARLKTDALDQAGRLEEFIALTGP
jgi:hypothetical protein